MVKYKFNTKLFTALLPCTESEYQFHITTKMVSMLLKML